MQEEIMTQRAAKARQYLEEHLGDQDRWYDDKATWNKTWHVRLGLIVIVAGATISVMQVVAVSAPERFAVWIAIITALLGATVVIAKGVDQLWKFDENWSGYRKASESIKREERLFRNSAGPYRGGGNEASAYILFVERVEEIIAAEQQTFWVANVGQEEKEASESS